MAGNKTKILALRKHIFRRREIHYKHKINTKISKNYVSEGDKSYRALLGLENVGSVVGKVSLECKRPVPTAAHCDRASGVLECGLSGPEKA